VVPSGRTSPVPTDTPRPAPPAIRGIRTLRILVVDDLEPAVSLLVDALSVGRHTVDPAEIGDGLRSSYRGACLRPVVEDLQMPQMDGPSSTMASASAGRRAAGSFSITGEDEAPATRNSSRTPSGPVVASRSSSRSSASCWGRFPARVGAPFTGRQFARRRPVNSRATSPSPRRVPGSPPPRRLRHPRRRHRLPSRARGSHARGGHEGLAAAGTGRSVRRLAPRTNVWRRLSPRSRP